jgi:putative nucleotidyltransferase with HDIG domain
MADHGHAGEDHMVRIRAFIRRMPGLSTTAVKVLRICNVPSTCANDLNRVISFDPVLTGRVLQLVNSAFYALPGKVNSLTRAIVLLGINTVKNLVLSFAVVDSLGRDAFRAIPAREFWAHSLSTAVAARLLAATRGMPLSQREDYFVAGLMHDIGKVPLNWLFSEDYLEAAMRARGTGKGIQAEELALIGTEHCSVGAMIAERWQLSGTLRAAIGRHHHVEILEEDPGSLTAVVHLADGLAHASGAGMPGGCCLDKAHGGRVQDTLGLTPRKLDTLIAAVGSELEKARVFLEIAASPPPAGPRRPR